MEINKRLEGNGTRSKSTYRLLANESRQTSFVFFPE